MHTETLPTTSSSVPFSSSEPFAPTAAMLRYLAVCEGQEAPADEAARCEAAGISVRALARWRADGRFNDWLRGEFQRRMHAEVWEVWAVVNRLARAGNLQAAKLFLDRFDNADANANTAPETFQELGRMAEEERRLQSADCRVQNADWAGA